MKKEQVSDAVVISVSGPEEEEAKIKREQGLVVADTLDHGEMVKNAKEPVHGVVIVLSLLCLITLTGMVVTYFTNPGKSYKNDGVHNTFVVLFKIMYTLYWGESVYKFLFCCKSGTMYTTWLLMTLAYENENTDGKLETLRTIDRINRMIQGTPTIYHKVECFHMKAYDDGSTLKHDDDSKPNSGKPLKKVVTFTTEQTVPINHWTDVSNEIPTQAKFHENKLVMKVSMSKKYSCDDKDTLEFIQNHKSELHDKYRNQDEECEVSERFEIPHFEEKLIMLKDGADVSSRISVKWYLLSTLLLCSYWYRRYVAQVIQFSEYSIEKRCSMTTQFRNATVIADKTDKHDS